MANAQVVLDRSPSFNGAPFLRFNVIDNGDGTRTIYIEERTNSDAKSSAAAITATGDKLVGAPAGTVSGAGTTNTLPKWTNGPGGVLGDSRITDDGGNILVQGVECSVESPIVSLGDISDIGNSTIFVIDDATKTITAASTGFVKLGDVNALNNSSTIVVDDDQKLITIGASQGEIDIGDVEQTGNGAVIIINDTVSIVTLNCKGEFQMGDVFHAGNSTTLLVNDSTMRIQLNAVSCIASNLFYATQFGVGTDLGVTGSFTSLDGKTISVSGGIVIGIV